VNIADRRRAARGRPVWVGWTTAVVDAAAPGGIGLCLALRPPGAPWERGL